MVLNTPIDSRQGTFQAYQKIPVHLFLSFGTERRLVGDTATGILGLQMNINRGRRLSHAEILSKQKEVGYAQKACLCLSQGLTLLLT